MAYIRFNTGKTGTVSHDKGIAIWQVLNGEVEPENDAQAQFIASIQNIYLDRHNAPESYLKARAQVHAQMDNAGKLQPLPWFQK
jgi:hypothetical protein